MGKLRVLFQGDSITDMGRDRGDIRNMGSGYPLFVASNFRAARPNFDIDFFDLGISGDRVRDLRARWQSDCLDLRPDVLSVLIGINDTWRRYDSSDPSDTEEFERVYRSLLEDARRENPSLKIIIMEPFVLHVSEERASWREDLDPEDSGGAQSGKGLRRRVYPARRTSQCRRRGHLPRAVGARRSSPLVRRRGADSPLLARGV